MKLQGTRRSHRVEDRRGRPAGLAVGGLGLAGVIALAGAVWLLGGDPLVVLQLATEQGGGSAPRAGDDQLADFASRVLASTEDVWGELLGPRYVPPSMVLFTDRVASACGRQSAAVGPFYCPGDAKVYLDLAFFDELSRRLGAPGDFAQAYVIAHEVGHHVQNVTGVEEQVRRRQAADPSAENAWSVRMELQADCLAGVWGHHAASLLEPGDIEEGLRAAGAIGDDVLQARSRGGVVPESFTHGTAAQRQEALARGLRSGTLDGCPL
ncbi:MAG: neutral zinc metallopeptidase [Alphaproteobacteria bacterium]|nr:neutral zinc metallopeptidase [Alphaproteobacteria bacterium]MCB9695919.1 neutral zinc metallopeptidase [Alphaproteobacteria bacterium]